MYREGERPRSVLDCSQVDMLRSRYKSVNFGEKKKPTERERVYRGGVNDSYVDTPYVPTVVGSQRVANYAAVNGL